ncbi:hypothetical protein QN239_32400 [Mycolicibacterium sp. Y3]
MSHQRSQSAPRALAAAVCRHDRQWTLTLQEACDDVYCSPLDLTARKRLRELLQRERGMTLLRAGNVDALANTHETVDTREWVRTLRIACDELHDGPEDTDAQDRLLLLLTEPAHQR